MLVCCKIGVDVPVVSMLQLQSDWHVRLRLAILAQDVHLILIVFYHFEMAVEHLGRLLKGRNLEPLGGIEVLHALARRVHDLAGEPDIDEFKVRRHLERNGEVLV